MAAEGISKGQNGGWSPFLHGERRHTDATLKEDAFLADFKSEVEITFQKILERSGVKLDAARAREVEDAS
jgi:hypothetical protein